jgi:hypothetical protein
VRHNVLTSLHALKVPVLSAPDLADRLVREARLQASLKHPNIAPVTDLIDINGAPGVISEWVDGPALDQLMRDQRPRPPLSRIDALARDLISAVAAAHAHGVVHRDLRPSNVLVADAHGLVIPKIVDFGIAKALSESLGPALTRTGAMLGTPGYMAPEQVRDAKHVGAPADVFSLGALLYELVTGEQAFSGGDRFEIFSAVAEGRYRPPRERVPDLPDRMDAAIAAALQVDPEARCSTGDLLAIWTGRGQAVAPVHARSAVGAPDQQTAGAGQGLAAARIPDRPERGTGRAVALGLLAGGGGVAAGGLGVIAAALVIAVGVWAVRSPGADGIEPAAVDTGREVASPDAADGRPGLPADLDPATTTPNGREDALRRYRSGGGTATVLAVLKGDPSPTVRVMAAETLRHRWRNGVDPSGTGAAVTWGAQHAEPPEARAKCLRTLGDHGGAGAGPVLAASVGAASGEVRGAAIDGCREWLQRNLGASDIAARCTPPPRSVEDRIDEGLGEIDKGIDRIDQGLKKLKRLAD